MQERKQKTLIINNVSDSLSRKIGKTIYFLKYSYPFFVKV